MLCHWLLWLVVVLLILSLPGALRGKAESQVTVPEGLLNPLVRRDEAEGPLFPWRLSRSRRRRAIRLPQWVSHLLGLCALFRQMSHWNMAQWVAFLSGYQIARFVGGILFLYPILKELDVAEIVDEYCPKRTGEKHGLAIAVLVLNRLTAPRPLYKVERWMVFTILPLVLGIPACKFNDDYLGGALDAIEPHLETIWLEIIIRAFEHYGIDLSVIFYDLTAFTMMGEYKDSQQFPF